jgi:hypothetical protein
MSSKYKDGDVIPTEVLCERVKELIRLIMSGEVRHPDFTMRVPAELDRDADLVLHAIVERIEQLEQHLSAVQSNYRRVGRYWLKVPKAQRDAISAKVNAELKEQHPQQEQQE